MIRIKSEVGKRIARPVDGRQLKARFQTREIHGDAAAQVDDHRIAVYRLHALLEMPHQIADYEFDAFRIVNQSLQCDPICLEVLLLRQLLAFVDFLKLRVQLLQFGGVQAQFGNAALVIDRHRGLVGDGALDVVDGNVTAEYRPLVRVRLLAGRAGEAHERRFGQGIAQVAGEAIGHLARLFIHLAA